MAEVQTCDHCYNFQKNPETGPGVVFCR